MRHCGWRRERDVFCTEDGLARAVRNLSHSGARAVAVAAEALNVRPRCAMFREVGAMEPSRGRRVTRGRVGRDTAPLSCPRWGAGAPWRRGPPASRPVTARLEWPSWARTSGRGAPSRTSSTAWVCRNPWRWTRRRSPALRADRSPCGGSSPGPVGLRAGCGARYGAVYIDTFRHSRHCLHSLWPPRRRVDPYMRTRGPGIGGARSRVKARVPPAFASVDGPVTPRCHSPWISEARAPTALPNYGSLPSAVRAIWRAEVVTRSADTPRWGGGLLVSV